MRRTWSLLYVSLWLVFLPIALVILTHWDTQVLITIFPLLAIGAWMYGRTVALFLVLVQVIYHSIVSTIHGDIYTYYEDRLTGAFLGIAIALLVGRLRNSYDALKKANHHLDRRVEARNTELSLLTAKLINDAEATRIRHGQTLHDGLGQELTGIQLYCTSLAEQLVADNNPSASLAFSMRTKAEKVHNIVRKIARMLFPVRMKETGLIPAINELVSCLSDIKDLSIDAKTNGDFDDMPEKVALTLYRICHESAMVAMTELNASSIQLDIHADKDGYQVALRQNGMPWAVSKESRLQQLILYRLQALGGMLTNDSSSSLVYRIPKVA